MGSITGDVECLGKLSITGRIIGNSSAAEVYVNTERLEGSITSEGCVKVGLGTVVVGDIVATSGVIAGAVKGEIDINGPNVVDSTAIIKGNIKAKSVQINNGAVIEGFCSLSYSSVDVDNIFE
jgi:cytoskeletal protein CcmA (bactofilin family)